MYKNASNTVIQSEAKDPGMEEAQLVEMTIVHLQDPDASAGLSMTERLVHESNFHARRPIL